MSNNRELKSVYGNVRNISNKKMRKRKLYKTVIMTISTISLATIIAITASGCGKEKISSIPEGQVKTYITMQVESGETISDIADRFYTDDCEGVYNSFSNYQSEIKEKNNISKFGSHIEVGDTLQIPVIINEDNPYYLQILEIQNKISDIEDNNLWVKYTVQYGDRISTIAELASGSYSETYEIADKIASKNGMYNKSILNAGQEIWIMNPELGKLKFELKEAQEQFVQSLIGTQIKK